MKLALALVVAFFALVPAAVAGTAVITSQTAPSGPAQPALDHADSNAAFVRGS